MATPAQRPNTWILDQWYDQSVAGTTGGYVENFAMFTWGDNEYGQLGQSVEFNPDRSSPCQVPGTTAIWSNKTSACTTSNQNARMCAIKTDGTAWGWGLGPSGQLGHNDVITPAPPVVSPRQVGTDTTWRSVVAGDAATIWTKTDGTLWMCGSNNQGGLGLNEASPAKYSSPVQIGTGTDWSENVWVAQQGRSGGVKTDGTLWQWGYADNGTIGNNTNQGVYDAVSSPIQIPGTTWATTLGNTAFTEQNFMMLKTDGTLWAWGYNQWGALANNKTNYSSPKGGRSSPTQIPGSWLSGSLGGGRYMSAVKTDGTLWVWGRDQDGSLAQNAPSVPRSSPVQVGTDTNWLLARNSEDSNTLAIKTDGTLWGWGYNQYGGLGLNNRTSYSSPVQIPGTGWTQAIVFKNFSQAFKRT